MLAGGTEVAGAVTASTLTTVAVFSPIALVGGMVGQLFAPFAITVTVALLASLLVSLTVIPVLAYWFLKPAAGGATPRRSAGRPRRGSCAARCSGRTCRCIAFRHPAARWSPLARRLVLFVCTVGLAGRLETNFFDESGQTTLSVTQTLPVGTSLATTDAAAKKVEEVLADTDGGQDLPGQHRRRRRLFGIGGGGADKATYSVTVDRRRRRARGAGDAARKLDALADAGEIKVDAGGGGGLLRQPAAGDRAGRRRRPR